MASPPSASVTADDSGYFISYTDGFEDFLTPDTISSLSASYIENIVKTGNAGITYEKAVGKLVKGYRWQMIGIINPDTANFKTGAVITLKIPEDDVAVPVTIEAMLETDDPEKRVLVLSCSEFRAEFAQSRVCHAELVLNDFTGIRIPRSAIRFNPQNEKGVYILEGQKILFKKIASIYETDDYVVSSTPDSTYISLYDDVITEGEIPMNMVDFGTSATEPENMTAASNGDKAASSDDKATTNDDTVTETDTTATNDMTAASEINTVVNTAKMTDEDIIIPE
jgi:hypothetical protein